MENTLTEYIQRVNFQFSKAKPMSNEELHSVIVDQYTDYLSENNNSNKTREKFIINFDEFFYNNMIKINKITKIAEEKIESVIMALKNNNSINIFY